MDWLLHRWVDGLEELVNLFDDLSDLLEDLLGIDIPGPVLIFLMLLLLAYLCSRVMVRPR